MAVEDQVSPELQMIVQVCVDDGQVVASAWMPVTAQDVDEVKALVRSVLCEPVANGGYLNLDLPGGVCFVVPRERIRWVKVLTRD